MTPEQWRPVVGYEGLYEVSDLGRVRSLPRKGTTGRILSPKPAHHGGYPYVTLGMKGQQRTVSVHALVLEAFVGPRPVGMWCQHRDRDPLNVALPNLFYGRTQKRVP